MFVCILLVAVAGAVQVAHSHVDGADTHADCSLCAAAHISVNPAPAPVVAPSVAVFTLLDAVPAVVLPAALSTFALFTRPPPVANVPA